MTAQQHQRMRERELVSSRNNAVREGQEATSRLRQLGFALATVSLTVVLCLGSAEILLRFLPVQSGLRTMPVNAENPVFHFTPERDVTFSRAWNFDMVNHRRVNNAGWVNDQDYQHQAETPLLAIVGDSYIEAMMVPLRGDPVRTSGKYSARPISGLQLRRIRRSTQPVPDLGGPCSARIRRAGGGHQRRRQRL